MYVIFTYYLYYDYTVSLTTMSVHLHIYATNAMAKFVHLNTVVETKASLCLAGKKVEAIKRPFTPSSNRVHPRRTYTGRNAQGYILRKDSRLLFVGINYTYIQGCQIYFLPRGQIQSRKESNSKRRGKKRVNHFFSKFIRICKVI